jgi:hypothetical protein
MCGGAAGGPSAAQLDDCRRRSAGHSATSTVILSRMSEPRIATLNTTAPRTASVVGGTGEVAGISGTGVELGRVTGLDPNAHIPGRHQRGAAGDTGYLC